jgi:hypothetical protein
LILILIIKFCLLQSDQHLMTPLMMRKFLISYSPFSPIGNVWCKEARSYLNCRRNCSL